MKISLIVVTARMGCLDVLYWGLLHQRQFDFKDCEIILVDSCYQERKPFVARHHTIDWLHLYLPKKYDYYDACWANNYGLRHATGELVIFFSDLNWPSPTFLADHWRLYKEFPGYSMTGYCDRYPIPRLKETLTWENSSWSIFQQQFCGVVAGDFFRSVQPVYQERKGNAKGPQIGDSEYFELPCNLFYGSLNESIPMAVLKEINGWDEVYDGAYGCADIDLGLRAAAVGWKFLINPKSINNKLGMQGTVNIIPGMGRPRIRENQSNLDFFNGRLELLKEGKTTPKAAIGAW